MPFSKTIPATKLYERASYQEAVARIRFCIAESLLGVIIGEVGVGRTVAVRAAASQLDPAAHHVIYISTPTFGPRGLYVTIVNALGALTLRHPTQPTANLTVQSVARNERTQGAQLEQHARQHNAAGSRRLDVSAGQPSVEREHRRFDAEANHESCERQMSRPRRPKAEQR